MRINQYISDDLVLLNVEIMSLDVKNSHKLARDQDPKPRLDFGEFGGFMLTEMGFTDTVRDDQWYIFVRADGLNVKVSKKILGPRSLYDEELNFDAQKLVPTTGKFVTLKRFYIGREVANVSVHLEHAYGYNLQSVAFEKLDYLTYKVKTTVAEFDATPIQERVAAYVGNFEFRREVGIYERFRNSRHDMTLHIKYSDEVGISLMTKEGSFPELIFCKNDVASVCEAIKAKVGMYYEPNITGRVAEDMKDFGFVQVDRGSCLTLVNGKYVVAPLPMLVLDNAKHRMTIRVWYVSASRARVEFAWHGDDMIQKKECYNHYESIRDAILDLF